MKFERILENVPRALAIALLAGPFSGAAEVMAEDNYCDVTSAGEVIVSRPQADDAGGPIDDVNWFARPVPNRAGDYVVAFASHNQNYLYNLTTGQRVAIPDKSDAVATPDGRFVTVPSYYTPGNTVNFYDTQALLDALANGEDAREAKPAFEHDHSHVRNTFYQSAGILSSQSDGDDFTTKYRMMFSGSTPPTPPGFLIADYLVERKGGKTTFSPSPVLRLCPEIVGDMGTPFISKDGRYIVAHDSSNPESPATLKIFEITDVDYDQQRTSCELVIDFGFRAGKADFSFDNSRLTFHLSSNDYITTFIDGGITAPHITDVVVVDLEQDGDGAIVGYSRMSRLTTSVQQGIGNYFPAFFPDDKLFYISNKQPRSYATSDGGPVADRRFELLVIDPDKAMYRPNVFDDERQLANAVTIGRMWQSSCTPGNNPLMPPKPAWHYLSLTGDQCASLVNDNWTGRTERRNELLSTCRLR
jgi:hypothetical protein